MFRDERPDPAGVYRVLRSMDRRGLVTSSWDLGKAGPAKRLFTLTARGRACLNRWGKTLEQYARSIDDLLATIWEISRDARAAR
jgi:DNA-binding PadR family transcriptional regulator